MRDSVTLQSLYSVVASSAAQMVVRVASQYEVVRVGTLQLFFHQVLQID